MIARRQSGFTLVEMIVVIVITGILGAIATMFLKLPMQQYRENVARAELSDQADIALRRLARDLRLALPNSIRITSDGSGNTYVEFLQTKIGLRYLDESDGVVGGQYLNWTTASQKTFAVVGKLPTAVKQAVTAGDYVVVYNLGDGYAPANAYDCSSACNRAVVASADTTANTITMVANPFPSQSPSMKSPEFRFQVISSPVTYVCNSSTGVLRRYWDYAIQATQPSTVAALSVADTNKSVQPSSALVASDVRICQFQYSNLANTHAGMVGLVFGMKRNIDGNSTVISLFHQVHVDNTP